MKRRDRRAARGRWLAVLACVVGLTACDARSTCREAPVTPAVPVAAPAAPAVPASVADPAAVLPYAARGLGCFPDHGDADGLHGRDLDGFRTSRPDMTNEILRGDVREPRLHVRRHAVVDAVLLREPLRALCAGRELRRAVRRRRLRDLRRGVVESRLSGAARSRARVRDRGTGPERGSLSARRRPRARSSARWPGQRDHGLSPSPRRTSSGGASAASASRPGARTACASRAPTARARRRSSRRWCARARARGARGGSSICRRSSPRPPCSRRSSRSLARRRGARPPPVDLRRARERPGARLARGRVAPFARRGAQAGAGRVPLAASLGPRHGRADEPHGSPERRAPGGDARGLPRVRRHRDPRRRVRTEGHEADAAGGGWDGGVSERGVTA